MLDILTAVASHSPRTAHEISSNSRLMKLLQQQYIENEQVLTFEEDNARSLHLTLKANFNRSKNLEGSVIKILYDPNRSANIAYIQNNTQSYVILASSSHGLLTGAIDNQAALLTTAQGHSNDVVQHISENKRMLRVHRTSSTEEVGEERMLNPGLLDKMMASQTVRSAAFERLVKAKWTDRSLYNALNLDFSSEYRRIFQAYQNHLENFAPHLISK
ncbi:unnamed protein product [Phytophthora fragariaefolia]|uniref:RxLR effector protein n=1 Tax=Phytophthora fragariaefolia TaxID=1490495 RepID=A0A9W7D1J4_9STRA|nr:unnamed protein product [Phytophthora fragariaefolia]